MVHLNKQSADIAIIGVACRFPDADHYHEFWENINSGKDSIREVPIERWDPDLYYSADISIPNKTISKWGGFMFYAGDPAKKPRNLRCTAKFLLKGFFAQDPCFSLPGERY